MDPRLCRDHLEKLIAEEHAALTELEQLLVGEHAILIKNDLTAVETASEQRQIHMGELLRIQSERRSLLRMHGYADDKDGINQLLIWCDPPRALSRSWSECAQSATRCRDLNERNAALVAARMKRVEGLLEVIVGPGNYANVYSASGQRDSGRSGSLLAAEA